MGNTTFSVHPKMGLVALSKTMPLTRSQLEDLMDECIIVTCGFRYSSFTIDRESFREVLLDTVVERQATDILDLLFTMWDITGNDFIQYREFLVGVSPLASSPRDTLSAILRYSLNLMDTANTGRTTQANLLKTLMAINSTASYIGDAVLKPREVHAIAQHVFFGKQDATAKQEYSMSHDDIVPRLVMHPMVRKFVIGAGTFRYHPPTKGQLATSKQKKGKKRGCSSIGILYEC